MAELSEAGCVGFSQASTPIVNTQVLLRAMLYANTYGFTVWLQPQDPFLGRGGVAHSGAVATRLGLPGYPGGERNGGAAHDLRPDAVHRLPRPPVPSFVRRRRRTGAPGEGDRPAGDRRRRRALSAPDRRGHRLLRHPLPGRSAVSLAARPRGDPGGPARRYDRCHLLGPYARGGGCQASALRRGGARHHRPRIAAAARAQVGRGGGRGACPGAGVADPRAGAHRRNRGGRGLRSQPRCGRRPLRVRPAGRRGWSTTTAC